MDKNLLRIPPIRELRTIQVTTQVGEATILCLISRSRADLDVLTAHLERVIFPPGGRSTSILAFTRSASDRYEMQYLVESDAGSASLMIEDVPEAVPGDALHTLQITGALPIIFGHYVVDEIKFLSPRDYSLFRTSLVIDGRLHTQRSTKMDWLEIMREIETELPIG